MLPMPVPVCRTRFASVRLSVALPIFAAMIATLLAWPANAQPELPYTGVIAVDRVEARGSAGRVFYPVAVLEKGDRVIVENDDYFTWFRIQAPSSVRAVINQADVEAGGDGSRGVVTSDIAAVRVKGVDRTAGDSFKTLISLSKGDPVTILDREGSVFIIEAPRSSTVFLPPGSVVPLENQPEFDAEETPPTPQPTPAPAPAETPPPTAQTPPTSEPVDDAPEAVTVGTAGDMVPLEAEVAPPSTEATDTAAASDTDAETELPPLVVPPPLPEPTADADMPMVGDSPATSAAAESEAVTEPEAPLAAPVETLAVNDALRAVELEVLPLFNLPVEEQPLDQIEAAYSQVSDEHELTGVDARIVENRLAAVSRNRQFAAALAQIAQRQSAVPTLEPLAVEPEPDEPFAAVGVMSVSTVLSGDGTRVFRVVDPASRRTIAYVQPAVGVDPALSLGQIVGVRGQRQYDPSLNAQLIIAQQVRVLDAN
ncbi:MAG: hypothetical protein AAGE65_14810 [Planctomycetota bacterium]